MNQAGVYRQSLLAQAVSGRLIRWLLPYLALAAILVLVFAVMALRGFDLGFVGDVLAYEYHYDRLGIQGGMNWLVNVEWKRHLLASIYSAPVHLLFPGQSAAWYALAFLIHFANGMMVFLLVDTMLRGQRRWLAFAAALMFVFHTLQIVSHFEFPTGSHRKAAMFLSLLSLWLYLQWVRRNRSNRWLREGSLVTYAIAVASYEQTAFFFLLHPIIACFEDRQSHTRRDWLRWSVSVALDSIWYALFFAAYLFVLNELFVDSGNIAFSINSMVAQITGALRVEFSPVEFSSRLAPAFDDGWLLLTLTFGAAVFALIALWGNREQPTVADGGSKRAGLWMLVVFGAAMIIVTILAVAPTQWSLAAHPRLIYPTSIGFALLVCGGIALLLDRLSNWRVQQALFALVPALLIGAGVTRTFQVQQDYLNEQSAREAVKAAILDTIPAWQGDSLPYLLIVSDAHPTRDLALHAQDVKFPLMFDMMYGVDGIAADAIYPDVPASGAPAPDLHGSRYNGPYIVVEPEGIYSPLEPGVPIDPRRLVIVHYDSVTQVARVLDELPADVLATANIVQRAPIEWRTNYSLVGSQALQQANPAG